MWVLKDFDVNIVGTVSHALFDLGEFSYLRPAGSAGAERRCGKHHHQRLVSFEGLVDGELVQIEIWMGRTRDMGNLFGIFAGMGDASGCCRADGRRARLFSDGKAGLGEDGDVVLRVVVDVDLVESNCV